MSSDVFLFVYMFVCDKWYVRKKWTQVNNNNKQNETE